MCSRMFLLLCLPGWHRWRQPGLLPADTLGDSRERAWKKWDFTDTGTSRVWGKTYTGGWGGISSYIFLKAATWLLIITALVLEHRNSLNDTETQIHLRSGDAPSPRKNKKLKIIKSQNGPEVKEWRQAPQRRCRAGRSFPQWLLAAAHAFSWFIVCGSTSSFSHATML